MRAWRRAALGPRSTALERGDERPSALAAPLAETRSLWFVWTLAMVGHCVPIDGGWTCELPEWVAIKQGYYGCCEREDERPYGPRGTARRDTVSLRANL